MKFSAALLTAALTQVALTNAAPGCRNKQHSAAGYGTPKSMEPHPVPSASAVYSAPAPVKSYAASAAASAPAKAPVYSSAAAAPVASSAPSTGSSPTSGGKALIDSINVYRKTANLPLFAWDDTLAANSYKTCKDAGGTQLVHELNPGSFGQVLVYGFDDADKCDKDTKNWTPFEIFWYSWLCEVPSDPALGGICQQIADIGHINSGGQTGHHDILASKQYTKIGCGFYRNPAAKACDPFPGVWGCDVA